ncbi:MAG: cold shock domain-containing protein [Actinomycetota bacterium]|nr:cold shock domain-containing protein [Actinomycetota bacterium]MDA3018879.1 cold shock domain-containing protein [Actinomycetota bacterium]
MRGIVTAFDAHVGLGDITMTDGTIVMFHCAEIADGSRQIEVGSEVECDIVMKFNRAEASAIQPA